MARRLSTFEKLYRQSIKLENQRIKEANERIKQDNQLKVDSWNKEIIDYYNFIDSFTKNVKLVKFNPNYYYDSQLKKFKFREYKPLPKPNEKAIKKQVGYIKENKILESIFKNRQNQRLRIEDEFKEKLKNAEKLYNNEEKENKIKYDKEKENYKKEIDAYNSKILERKNNFLNNDTDEIQIVLEDWYKNFFVRKNQDGIGAISTCINVAGNNPTDWVFDIKFGKFEDIVPTIKKYIYLKTKNDYKEINYSRNEREYILEKIIFNSAFQLMLLISFYFKDIIKNINIKCYVEDIDLATGKNEKKYIMSAIFPIEKINFDNIDMIEPKAFFDYVGAKYNLPFFELKKIIPYSFDSSDTIDYIDNKIDGFDFEKISKIILEKNGFYDVYVTKASGDYGADVIAYKDKIKYAIQCKKFASKVGVKAVQEVMASREMYKCHVGAILTNNYFTPNAIKLAEENKILLWDLNELSKMIDKMNNNEIIQEKIEINFENVEE